MDIPKTCLSFSPNWFYPQIVVCSKEFLYYGANDGVYIYNHVLKRFYAHINIGIKITMVEVTGDSLYVGLEGGCINIYDLSISTPKYKGKIELNMQRVIHFLPYGEEQFLAFDERGVGIQMRLQNCRMSSFSIRVMKQTDKPKLVIPFASGHIMVLYEKGQVFSQIREIEYAYKILHADVYGGNQLVILNKKNNHIGLHIMVFEGEEDLLTKLANKALPTELSQGERFYPIRMIMNDKLPVIDKGSLTVKFVSESSLILTSRQGEFYVFQWDQDTLPYQEVNLNPKALESSQTQQGSIRAAKNPIDAHYKMVYLLNRVHDTNLFYSVGTDRRICMFRVSKTGDIEMYWKLVLLASRVTNICACPTEKNLVFFSGPELSLRSLDMQKKHDQCYVNEFWKGVPQFKEFIFHPELEGVVALIGLETKISNNNHQIIKSTVCSFDVKEPVSQVFWFSDITLLMGMLELLRQTYGLQQNIHTQYPVTRTDQKHLSKEYNLQYLVLVKGSAKLTIISLKTFQTIYEDTLMNAFGIQSLIKQKYGQLPELITIKTSLLSLQTHSTFLNVHMVYNQQNLVNLVYYPIKKQLLFNINITPKNRLHVDIYTSNQQINCICSQYVDQQLYIVVGSMDRNVYILKVNENQQYSQIKRKTTRLSPIGHLKHRQPIHKVKMNESYSILAIAKQSQTLQVWNVKSWIQKNPNSTKEEISTIDASFNVRGHAGFIIDAEFDPINPMQVVTSSDDQTLKVWDLSTIANTKPPNKKKKKKNEAPTKKVKLNSGQAAESSEE